MSSAGSPDNHTNSASSPATTHGPSPWALVGVGLCFVLSGFAALLYQTAWMRQFSLVFGTSEVAVATVLAAYMGGLALGARVVERYLDRVHRPVLVYGALEFGVALGALAVPALLIVAENLMVAAIGDQPSPPAAEGWAQTSFYLATAFVVLVLPTALMGATLPLLTRHAVHSEAHIAARTGLLYAVNTLGAVAGALVAAFILLPQIGLRSTVMVGAIVNVLVFGIAALLSARAPARGAHAATSTRPPPAGAASAWERIASRGRHWILPLMLVSGAASFVYEVLWTRMLSFVLGGSIFAFATMVASFLLGIAAGSAVASQLVRTRERAAIAFVIAQLAIAGCSIAIYLALEGWVPDHAGLRGNVMLAIGVLLPATLFIGATFPLAVRILADEPAAAARATARTYAWNTVGAIAGALLAGFVLIPELRFEGTIRVAVGANALLALVTAAVVVRAPLVWSAAAAVACVTIGFGFRAPVPDRLLRASPLNVGTTGDMRFYAVGRSATVVVLEQNGALLLRTNGLPEAMIDVAGAPAKYSGEFWLSPLAVIARPGTRSMLVVGYGGGVVVDGIPPSVGSVDVIELEPKVIDANRAIRELRARDPLRDERVNLVINDARGALALTRKRYDAIVSQPSHPWTAGASHLYTREFMQQAAVHLNEGGVFVQWMNISFLDEELLRSLAATLLDVFGQLRIYRPDPNTLVFLASRSPLDVEAQLLQGGAPLVYSPRHYARFGIQVAEDVLTALVADQEGATALARGAELITDDRNRMATAGAYDRGTGLTPATTSSILARYDPLQRRGGWVFRELGGRVAFGYIARRMATFRSIDAGAVARIERMARAVEQPAVSAYATAVALGNAGNSAGSNRLLEEALGIDPANDEARFELIRPWLGALATDQAPPAIRARADELSANASAVVQSRREAVAGEWARVTAFDPQLRNARWTDAWYIESVQMRADWRTRVNNPQVRARFGREALAMLEEIVVTQPTTAMLQLRARAALAAERPEVLLESIGAIAQATFADVAGNKAQSLPEMRAHAESLLRSLERFDGEQRVRSERVAQVRARLERARSEILARAGESTGVESAAAGNEGAAK